MATIKEELILPVLEPLIHTSDISTEVLNLYAKQVYDDIFTYASTFNNSYFTWSWWIADIIAGMNEYTLPQPITQEERGGLRKLLDIYFLKNGKYEKVKRLDIDALNKSMDSYETAGEDFSFKADLNSIFFFPTPTIDIPKGLKVIGTYLPLKIAIDDDIATYLLPREYDELFMKGLEAKILHYKKEYTAETIAKNDYLLLKSVFRDGTQDEQDVLEQQPFNTYQFE